MAIPFLSRRPLEVKVRESLSNPIEIVCDVTQGLIFGPQVFSIYINDLVGVITLNCQLYADEDKVWRPIRSPTDHTELQTDLDRNYEWPVQNRLPFNISKCRVLHPRRQAFHNYKAGDQGLQHCPYKKPLRALGIHSGWSTRF